MKTQQCHICKNFSSKNQLTKIRKGFRLIRICDSCSDLAMKMWWEKVSSEVVSND